MICKYLLKLIALFALCSSMYCGNSLQLICIARYIAVELWCIRRAHCGASEELITPCLHHNWLWDIQLSNPQSIWDCIEIATSVIILVCIRNNNKHWCRDNLHEVILEQKKWIIWSDMSCNSITLLWQLVRLHCSYWKLLLPGWGGLSWEDLVPKHEVFCPGIFGWMTEGGISFPAKKEGLEFQPRDVFGKSDNAFTEVE